MIATTISFLSTVAVQIGAAVLNNRNSKQHNEEMARRQRVYEEKVAREGIENARAEFREMCDFQKEMEAEMHKHRLKLIRDSLTQNISLDAYAQSLANWPLMVPPYVLKNDSIYESQSTDNNAVIPLNCIIAGSQSPLFNGRLRADIEENVAEFCSKYHNISSAHAVRFLQEAWRNPNAGADAVRLNLYVHLKNVPTLVLSPVVKPDNHLIFRFYWWGLTPDSNEAHINGYDEFDPDILLSDKTAAGHDNSQIIEGCSHKLQAFISYFADLYYWNFYHQPPMLPALIGNKTLTLPQNDVKAYAGVYTSALVSFCKSDDCIMFDPHVSAAYLVSQSLIVNRVVFAACFKKYITKKLESNTLNCTELAPLQSLRDTARLLPQTAQKIDNAIAFIEEHEEIGYFPCAGYSDLGQVLLTKGAEMQADYAVVQEINPQFGYIRFFDSDNNIIVNADGFRYFIAAYPQHSIKGTVHFNIIDGTFENISNESTSAHAIGLSNEDVSDILQEQSQFINTLINNKVCGADNDTPVFDTVTFSDMAEVLDIMKQSAPNAKIARISVGFSTLYDKYIIAANLLEKNTAVGDSFLCLTNSLHKTFRKEMNGEPVFFLSQFATEK